MKFTPIIREVQREREDVSEKGFEDRGDCLEKYEQEWERQRGIKKEIIGLLLWLLLL